MQKERLVYRSSGKILIAGGYGVLQQGNFGISLAVDRHFYAIVRDHRRQSKLEQVQIRVQSPQIRSQWDYKFNKLQENIVQQHGLRNPFVQNAIKFALKYAVQKQVELIDYLAITILFDRGFLSQSQEQQKQTSKFINYQENVSKTGLGSSACVLVVIVRAILGIVLPQATEIEVNCISQVANIAAQNKIGSNFDISTAVFGSQLYKNKLPKKAFEVLENGTISHLLEINPQIEKINPNHQINSNSCCFMIDLKKGSNTRVMVSSFIKTLHSLSNQLITQFYRRNKVFAHQIFKILEAKFQRTELIDKLRQTNHSYRQFLQLYSKQTNVPIQPPEFKQFLDCLNRLDGVSYVICPGSGGYDAIFLLSLPENNDHKHNMKKQIENQCQKYWNHCQVYEIRIEWQQLKISEQELKSLKVYLSQIL